MQIYVYVRIDNYNYYHYFHLNSINGMIWNDSW